MESFEQSTRPWPVPALLEGAGAAPGLMRHLHEIRRRVAAGRLPGIATGLKTFDERTGGLQKGLHLLAASPGAGKTTLALQVARSAARHGVSVVFLAFDEGGDRLALKLAAGMAGLKATDYLRGRGDPADIAKALEAHRDVLARVRIYVGPGGIAPESCGEMLAEAMTIDQADEGLLVVDYLQSWAARLDTASDFRMATSHLTGALRQVALQQGVPVLAIAAQNRAKQGEAAMTSLRESSDLEYSADSISFLTSDDDDQSQPSRRVTLATRKNRWGPTFELGLLFDAERGIFAEERRPL